MNRFRPRSANTEPPTCQYIRRWRDLPRRPYCLSTILTLYLEVRRPFHKPKMRAAIEREFRRAIAFFGDCCFTAISGHDINAFVNQLAHEGLRHGGIRHSLYLLHAGVRVFIKEYGLDHRNPFKPAPASDEQPSGRARGVLSQGTLTLIQAACLHQDDDIRWLLALLIDTGARVSEIAGLALDDIDLHKSLLPIL